VVISTFTSMVDVLGRGLLRDLFADCKSNIDPTIVEDGYILLIDLPVKEFGEVGLFAQSIWKYAFQRSIERRDIRKSPRPVFLWADEAQFFVTAGDLEFLSTARSSRVAVTYLSQNLPNFYAALGGEERGRAAADSIFGNLSLKIFHANGDPQTNHWAANLIGRTRQYFYNSNSSFGAPDGWNALFGPNPGSQVSAGMSEAMEFEVQPSVFNTLKSGGPAHRWQVEAIVFQSGKVFRDTGTPWRLVTFRQKRPLRVF
jgi:type IV secretory pathway TraG/TraD family ATPase VirD4